MRYFTKAVFVSFFVLVSLLGAAVAAQAQTPTPPKAAPLKPPAFLVQVKSKADFDKLTPAQQQEAEAFFAKVRPPSLAGEQADASPGIVNCFDYYTFGSVQVDLSPTLPQTLPGVPLTFVGKLKNDNPYPLVNGSVYVKIFKKEGEDSLAHQNGYPMVDFFEAGKDIVIAAKSEKDFTFNWQVPSNLSGGDYEADFFFVTNQRFNLLGLSFTDDVTGNKTSFHITSNNQEQAVFNKNAVTLNGKQYRFAVFPPHFTTDEVVKAEVELVNPSNVAKTVTLTWQLFNWDGLRQENRLDEEITRITLKPKETKTLSYNATKHTGSVSYLLVEAKDGDATSLMNIRFVRDGIKETRLNFPSITSFPIMEGKEMSIFSCVHSTTNPKIDANEILLSLTDADTDKTIHSFTYKGAITSAMMGVGQNFTPKKTFGKVNLTTTLKHDGQIIDTVIQTYDCAVIDAALCPKGVLTSIVGDDGVGTSSTGKFIRFGLLLILGGLLGFAIVMSKEKRRKKREENNNQMPL